MIGNYKVATLFVFPPSSSESFRSVLDHIKCPPVLRSNPRDARLIENQIGIVAIGFQRFELPKGEFDIIETYDSAWKTSIVCSDWDGVELSSKVRHAITTLRFPRTLNQTLAKRKCGVFDQNPGWKVPSPDTEALKVVLSSVPECKVIDPRAPEAEFIFIHVGSWDYLYKLALAGLVDRRLRRPRVQFITYGTSPMVDKKFWGIRDVFPIGS